MLNPLNTLLSAGLSLNNPFVKVLLPSLGIIFVILLTKYKYRYSFRDDLYVRKPQLSQLLLWTIITISWMLLSDYLINWRGPWDFAPWKAQPLCVSVLRVLAVCFLGPILEELVFRAMFFHRFAKVRKMNEWVVVLLLAAVWACIHYTYTIPVIAIIFVEGVLLGASVIKSRSLIVPIVMHICWNLYAIW